MSTGILIRGMELPKKGHRVTLYIDSGGHVFAAWDGGRTKIEELTAIVVTESEAGEKENEEAVHV